MVVNTRTVCPFPYTSPNGVNATSASECTITYGAALGGGFIFFQALLIFIGTAGMIIFGYRMILLRIYCKTKRISLRRHPVLIHLVLCFLFNLFLVIESIDLLGFWGLIRIEAYVVLDEIVTSVGMTNALLTVAFLYNIVRGTGDTAQEAKTQAATAIIGVLMWLNFIGFIIAGILDYSRYRLYEGLKILFGSLFFGCFGLLASRYAASLEQLLRNNLSLAADKPALEDRIRMLRQRHMRLVFVLAVACLAMFFGSIFTLTTPDWSWTLAIAEMPDPAQVVFKLIFILNVMLTVYLFRVPRIASSSTASQHTPNVPQQHHKHLLAVEPENVALDGNRGQIVAIANPLFKSAGSSGS